MAFGMEASRWTQIAQFLHHLSSEDLAMISPAKTENQMKGSPGWRSAPKRTLTPPLEYTLVEIKVDLEAALAISNQISQELWSRFVYLRRTVNGTG